MHWRSVRPEMVTTGTNRFPHFGQRVVRSMRSSRFFLPMAHWFHGGAGPNSPFSFHRNLRGEVCFGATQASVIALSITCRWTLLHSGQVNVRKSWPNVLGSIAVNLIGEPQAVHCGPWFCVSSMRCSPQFGALSSPASHPTEADFIGSLATTSFCTKWHLGHSNRRYSKMQGSVMPQAYFFSGPSFTRIERPHCSRCTSRMMLARISPGPMGFWAGACSTLCHR
jgi:hypothetical protein